MIGNKRVIGVCLTKIHWSGRSAYLDSLNRYATQNNYKLLVFNSFVDFYENAENDWGAKSVYCVINYDLIDALIIFSESINNEKVVQYLVDEAKKNKTPVILVDNKKDGCFSIISDYDDSYIDLMCHVLTEHHVKKTFFIAGMKEGDPTSSRRIACYRAALEKCGLPFDEKNVDYGEFWSDPAKRIVERLYESEEGLPEAFFCANDYMAIAVCEKLQEYGLKVPDDVIVTGFDGTDAACYSMPQISTCAEDQDQLARLCLETVEDALRGADCCCVKNKYITKIAESCGCKRLIHDDFRATASQLHAQVDIVQMHEDYMYSWMNRMFGIYDMKAMLNAVSDCILENSYVCLNDDLIDSIVNGVDRKHQMYSDMLEVYSSRYNRPERMIKGKLPLKEMVPGCKNWLEDDSVFVLNAIYVGRLVCGYYAYRTDCLTQDGHKIKRIVNTVNLAFTVANNYCQRMTLYRRLERAALVNSVTKLPNLKGALNWFKEFATPENRKKPLCVSVYGLPKYTYIQENYGIEAAEDAVIHVAKYLKEANDDDSYIAHIADDEFLVINAFKPTADLSTTISGTINTATDAFFRRLGEYNHADREYYVEVNCGCSPIDGGWQANLESFIKFAKGEMYMNRLKMGMGSVVKEESAPKEYYMAFDLLIEKNLFSYHFQPIVSAKNGEIYGYEALMRTDKSIGMNPLEVLHAAKEYNRLYEIEKATMFNIMNRYSEERQKFGSRKVFINTIPGHFLKDKDAEKLMNLHSGYMDKFVFELTEQDTVTDEELDAIHTFSGGVSSGRIAIDDYGTGHSNMANLLRYSPRIIKIDRFLIENIHRNQNKQLFVRSTVEFAKLNNILVLAEGVETSNELHTVIDLGVDLVQGYYLGRPVLDPIAEIPADIRQEILDSNPLYN